MEHEKMLRLSCRTRLRLCFASEPFEDGPTGRTVSVLSAVMELYPSPTSPVVGLVSLPVSTVFLGLGNASSKFPLVEQAEIARFATNISGRDARELVLYPPPRTAVGALLMCITQFN
jgi:hypothetical protein